MPCVAMPQKADKLVSPPTGYTLPLAEIIARLPWYSDGSVTPATGRGLARCVPKQWERQ
jgi:hypothetical protein